MNNKLKTVLISTIAMLASSNTAFALDCTGVTSGYCLTNKNASFQIDSQGAMEMVVDNITHVFTTDFVFNVNALNPDGTIDHATTAAQSYESAALFDYIDLGFPGVVNNTGKISSLSLAGMSDTVNTYNSWAQIELDFALSGGAAGSHSASVLETFTITNTSTTTNSVNLFAWTDIDVGGGNQQTGYPDDLGEIIELDLNGRPIAYRQYDTTDEVITRVSVAPDHYEVGLSDGGDCNLQTICDRIFNFSDTILRDEINVGNLPSDLNQAAEWVLILGAGESFTFEHHMQVNPIPVPAAVWLFGSGLLGLMGVARRKQQA